MSWDEIKKARRRLSREQGTTIKDWGGKIPIALVYPNSYYAGMSNLGVHTVYRLLNSYPEVVCERAFWEKEDRSQQLPPLSLESQRPQLLPRQYALIRRSRRQGMCGQRCCQAQLGSLF